MPFKKGTSGNPTGRPKGSVSTTTKLIREHISNVSKYICDTKTNWGILNNNS